MESNTISDGSTRENHDALEQPARVAREVRTNDATGTSSTRSPAAIDQLDVDKSALLAATLEDMDDDDLATDDDPSDQIDINWCEPKSCSETSLESTYDVIASDEADLPDSAARSSMSRPGFVQGLFRRRKAADEQLPESVERQPQESVSCPTYAPDSVVEREARRAISAVSAKHSARQPEPVGTKLKSMWNNVKYGWTMKRTTFSRSAPLWLLGEAYKLDETSARLAAQHGMERFRRDFISRLWFTYRRTFEELRDSTDSEAFSTDCGWGCMLRSGQMLLGQVY